MVARASGREEVESDKSGEASGTGKALLSEAASGGAGGTGGLSDPSDRSTLEAAKEAELPLQAGGHAEREHLGVTPFLAFAPILLHPCFIGSFSLESAWTLLMRTVDQKGGKQRYLSR